MRRKGSSWLAVAALSAAMSASGCAQSVIDPANDPPVPSTGDDGSASSGDDGSSSSGNNPTPTGDDGPTQPTPGTGNDASVAPGDDSSTSGGNDSSTPGDDSSTVGGNDAATAPDSSPTTGPQGQTFCPNTKKYKTEYNNAPASATSCSVGTDCSPTECCFQATVLFIIPANLCVPL